MTLLAEHPHPKDFRPLQTNVGNRPEISGSPLSGSTGTSGFLDIVGLVAITSIFATQPVVGGTSLGAVRVPKEVTRAATLTTQATSLGETRGVAETSSREGKHKEAGAIQVMLQDIRIWLSLNVTELARAIGVERTTIYAWLKGTDVMPRELAKRDRLQLLAHLAQQWRTAANEPLGSWRHFPFSNGRSLLDLLDAGAGSDTQRISDDELKDAVAQLAAEVQRAGEARARGAQQQLPDAVSEEQLNANLRWLRTTGAG